MMKKPYFILIILIIFLAACGQKGKEESSPSQRIDDVQPVEVPEEVQTRNWVIEEQALPDADVAVQEIIPENSEIFTENWFLINETVYRVIMLMTTDENPPEGTFFRGHCIQKLEPPYSEWSNTFIAPEDWVEGEVCEPWIYGDGGNTMTRDGLAVLLTGSNGTYLGEWNEETGAVAREMDGSLLRTEDGEKYTHWRRTQDGGLVLWADDGGILLGSDFAGKKKIAPVKEPALFGVAENDQDGSLYLIVPAGADYDQNTGNLIYTGIEVVAADEMQTVLSSDAINASIDDKMYFDTKTQGFLYQNFCIAECSLEEGEINILYDFHADTLHFDQMYNSHKKLKYMSIQNGIQGGYAKEDGSHILLVACGDDTWQVWRMHEDTQKSGQSEHAKKVVEWAITIPGIYEERAVSRFNQQSEEYEVVLRLPEEGEDFDDFRNRIQAELASGAGPDILTEQAVLNLEDGVRRGVLADITEYFADDGDEMLSSAWQMGIVDGKRYAVPYAYAITTLVADKALIDQAGWTLDEAMEYMEESDADIFMAGADEAQLFYYLGLLTETNSDLVDWQNRVSHLNSGKAAELLQFAARFADHESSTGNDYLRTAEGEAAVALLYLMSPEDMRVAAAMFDDREVYIGFPTANGQNGHSLYTCGLMVNQGSSNMEGAVAFIQFLLSEETQADMADRLTQNGGSGFPVRTKAMERIYRSLQREEDVSGELRIYGGLEYEAKPLSDESIQKLKELAESATPMGQDASRIFEIVNEEVKGIHTEGKSIEQVLDIINNRVQLYLDEEAE